MAVTSSSARGQPSGTIDLAHKFLGALQLGILNEIKNKEEFISILDGWTRQLAALIPSRSFGAARKLINLFLFLCARDHGLRSSYGFGSLDSWLEIAVDGHVAKGLKAFAGCRLHGKGDKLPWSGITKLRSDMNVDFQRVATELASELKIHRVEVDLVLWRRDKKHQAVCLLCDTA